MKSFWDAVRPTEKDHQLYLNHVMGCPKCNAPANRYCEPGKELLLQYQKVTEAALRGV